MKELKQQLDRYNIETTRVEENGNARFKATYRELGLTVSGFGNTRSDAIADLESLALDVLSDEPIDKLPAPQSETPWAAHSGRVTLRVPRMLHAQLDRIAEEQGSSLNQFMGHILNTAVTAILAGHEFGPCSQPGMQDITQSITSLRALLDALAVSQHAVKAADARFTSTLKHAGLKWRTLKTPQDSESLKAAQFNLRQREVVSA